MVRFSVPPPRQHQPVANGSRASTEFAVIDPVDIVVMRSHPATTFYQPGEEQRRSELEAAAVDHADEQGKECSEVAECAGGFVAVELQAGLIFVCC